MPDPRSAPSSVPTDATVPPAPAQEQPTLSGAPAVSEHALLAPPQAAGELGRLGSYRVLKELGRGGMGIVYQAQDIHLGRAVALKVMLPEVASHPDARERFLREARAQALIEHDHILTIYQVDVEGGVPYLAMPLLRGMPLDQYLKRGKRLPLSHILRIGKEIARGLGAAHERGLIHRDIKPGNIWLEACGGRVKILDFGLVRPVRGETQLTASGAIIGTPAYMPPEQIAGKAEARSDLYSLGVVLYRMLAGRLPFEQPDMLALLMAIGTEPPPALYKLAPQTPPALADLVMRLLAKDPANRPASAKALLEELRAVEKSLAAPTVAVPVETLDFEIVEDEATVRTPTPLPSPKKPRPVRKRRKRRRPWAIFLVLGVVLAGAVGLAVALLPGLAGSWTERRRAETASGAPVPRAVEDNKQHPKGVDPAKTPTPPKNVDPPRGGNLVPVLTPGMRPTPFGFVSLFDGKSLLGWEKHAQAKNWTAEAGVLRFTGKGRGFLQSRKSYGDFILDLEWRLRPGGNSGVFVRLDLPPGGNSPTSPEQGVEIQLLDNPRYPTVKPEQRCGAIFNLAAPKLTAYHGADRWHRYLIRCQGKRISVRIGAEVVGNRIQGGQLLSVVTAASHPPLRQLPARGPIGLQNWGTPVEFRNIFLKDLPPR